MGKKNEKKFEFIETVHPGRPDFKYLLPKEDKKSIKKARQQIIFPKSCQKVCSSVITLLPKRKILPNWGHGHYVVKVDGFRYLNAYIISDPLYSSNLRGFELEISFALSDFVYGEGSLGETTWFFNFDNYYNISDNAKRTINCHTSDLTQFGGLPWIGGNHLSHILRVPVMGPYVRASAFNTGSTEMSVEVRSYLTT